jgi:hypothetical protein
MPVQAGTWLGPRRARLRRDGWGVGWNLEAVAGEGPGLGGSQCANDVRQTGEIFAVSRDAGSANRVLPPGMKHARALDRREA